MTHKCDGCRYKGEHQEMMFRPFGVCNRGANLLEAIKNYDAKKCPYNKTNADRIRAMSDEELANFLTDKCSTETYMRLNDEAYKPTATQIEAIKQSLYCAWMRWLKQPVEDQQ